MPTWEICIRKLCHRNRIPTSRNTDDKNHLQNWARDRRRPTPLFLFGSKSRIHYEPYGCALIIAPWNYPLQLALSPLIGAIAAGNCAIVKPSGEAPRTAAALQELIDECFEEEYIAVTDANRETTELLLQERFDYIFYTGGVEYGRHVMQAASRHLTPSHSNWEEKVPVSSMTMPI